MIRPSLNAAYLLITGVSIIAVTVSFLVYRPMMATLSEKRERGQKLEQTIEERKTFLTDSASKKNTLLEQRTNEQILAVAFPVVDDMDAILRILHRAATAAGGTIQTIRNTSLEEQRDARIRQAQQGGETIPQFVVPLGADIQFNGSYQQLRVFLGELEKSPRLIDVSALDITRSGTVTDLISTSLTIRFYRYGTASN